MNTCFGLLIFFSVIHGGCMAQDHRTSGLLGNDVRLYQGGIAWELAQAVQHQQVGAIQKQMAGNPALARYQEPRFGQSLLLFAVVTHRYRAAKALVESGADCNLPDTYFGTTPLIQAAGIYETSDYVKLLLAHGANPNLASIPPDRTKAPTTPLIEASSTRLESVKLLVEAGADINSLTSIGYMSAISGAFLGRDLDILSYLIIEKKANYDIILGVTLSRDTLRVANLLRKLAYPLDSKEYQQKMKLVEYLEAHGVDYRSAPIPKRYYEMYPKDYLDKY